MNVHPVKHEAQQREALQYALPTEMLKDCFVLVFGEVVDFYFLPTQYCFSLPFVEHSFYLCLFSLVLNLGISEIILNHF